MVVDNKKFIFHFTIVDKMYRYFLAMISTLAVSLFSIDYPSRNMTIIRCIPYVQYRKFQKIENSTLCLSDMRNK